jgi:hypothetical protein
MSISLYKLLENNPILKSIFIWAIIIAFIIYLLSLFKGWDQLNEKAKRNRIILILISPLIIWFIVEINKDHKHIDMKKDVNSRRMEEFIDSVSKNNYKKKKQSSFDKFLSDTNVSSTLDSMYLDCIKISNGNIEDAKKTMKIVWKDEIGIERINRYFEITKIIIKKNGTYEIQKEY